MPKTRPPLLITVHSQKGGTGKTTLALLLQSALALREALSSVVIDLDLTGTTPAEALQLRAFAPGGDERLSVDETRKAANSTRSCWESDVAYMNYWLFSPPAVRESTHPRFGLREYVWAIEGNQGPECGLVPSSRNHEDIREAMEAIHYDEATELLSMRLESFVRAMLGLQDALGGGRRRRARLYDAVIIDTSPTLFGSSKIALRLHAFLRSDAQATSRAGARALVQDAVVHVMSPDVQSVRGSLGAFRDLEQELEPRHWQGITTVHAINMVPRDIPELGFGDRSRVIEYYSSRLAEGNITPPRDEEWALVRWDREIVREGIEPRSTPQLLRRLLDESTDVGKDIADLVTRVLGGPKASVATG